MIIWRPGSNERYTRRQLVRAGGRAGGATIVGGAFADLLAACAGGSPPPAPASSGGAPPSSPAAAPASASPAAPPATGPAAAAAAGEPVRGGTLRYATLGNVDYGSLDMTTTTGTYDLEIALGMQDAYVHLLPNGTFVPGLAESWQISDDGRTYTFKLRQDVVFHDGTPLDADAVKYNFDRMTDKTRNPSGLSYSYLGAGQNYEGCEVVDKYTVRHRLKAPNALFMYRMRRAYMSPQSPTAIEKYGADYFRNPVSVGPFKFVEWVEGDHVTLEAYDGYKWGPGQLFKNTGRPYLDRITHRIFKDLTTKATALESGEVDMAARLNPEDVVRLQDDKNVEVVIRDQQGQASVLDLNTERTPTNDLAVRKAIEFAIDREAISKSIFFGLLPAAYHFFTPDLWSYDDSLAKLYKYDPAQAEKLLDEAGWRRGASGVRSKEGQELRLKWLITQEQQPIAQLVQAQLQKVGLAVDLQTLTSTGLVEATTRGDHNIAGGTGGWVQEDPDVIRNWAHSSLINVRQNNVRARNKELDDLMEKGIAFAGDLHSPEREKLYKEGQRIIMENAYVVPLYYRKSFEAYRLNVVHPNIGYDPYGTYHYWNDVWLRKA